MKTVTIKGFIHAKPAEKYQDTNLIEGFQLSWGQANDMSAYGYTTVTPIDIEVVLPEGWNPRVEFVSVLEKKRAEVMKEFSTKVAEIDAHISRLLAIDYVEAV